MQLEETSWVESAKLVITNADGEKTTFPPLQFHFHTPSEHTVNGVHSEAEMHIVHKDENGNYSVVGILFDSADGSEDNNFLETVFGAFNTRDDSDDAEKTLATLPDILTGALDLANIWQYMGSLTTPSCKEGVMWNILQQV